MKQHFPCHKSPHFLLLLYFIKKKSLKKKIQEKYAKNYFELIRNVNENLLRQQQERERESSGGGGECEFIWDENINFLCDKFMSMSFVLIL